MMEKFILKKFDNLFDYICFFFCVFAAGILLMSATVLSGVIFLLLSPLVIGLNILSWLQVALISMGVGCTFFIYTFCRALEVSKEHRKEAEGKCEHPASVVCRYAEYDLEGIRKCRICGEAFYYSRDEESEYD